MPEQFSSAKLTTWLPSPHTTATTTLSSTNPDFVDNPSALIGGCTLECPEKIIYIDELDETDNCHVRMEEVKDFVAGGKQIRPEMEWLADGTVMLTMFFPAPKPIAEAAALECAKRMNLGRMRSYQP